jgi:hypothetical protein
VRQEAGLFQNELRTAGEVLERRLAAERAELPPGDLVPQLGLVAQREERLATTGRSSGACDREDLLFGHVRPFAAAGRAREGAVAADVAAQCRQRDEDLRRVGDEPTRAEPARLREELVERHCEKFPGVDHVRSILARERDTTRSCHPL